LAYFEIRKLFESRISGFDGQNGIIGKKKTSLDVVVFCYFENNSKVCPLKVCKAKFCMIYRGAP